MSIAGRRLGYTLAGMYIGVGFLVVVLLVILIIFLVRRA